MCDVFAVCLANARVEMCATDRVVSGIDMGGGTKDLEGKRMTRHVRSRQK